MARRCPICRLALRAHDPGWLVNCCHGDHTHALGWPLGAYHVCHDCLEIGLPGQCYPLAVPVPEGRRPEDDPRVRFWCPTCKTYAREDDRCRQAVALLRLEQEDLDGNPHLRPRPAKPGINHFCDSCWPLWLPVVHSRWVRDQIVPKGTPAEALGYNVV